LTSKILEKDYVLGVLLTGIILLLIGIAVFAAVLPTDAPLRLHLYLFWQVFFKNPIIILVAVNSSLLALLILSLTSRKEIVDTLLLLFSFSLTALFFFLLSLNLLNLGLSVLTYPFTILPIPPLKIHNPINGMIAFLLIMLKGLLLENFLFDTSSKIEKVCLTAALGFGTTSLQVSILSYVKTLYPTVLIFQDATLIITLMIIWQLKKPNFSTNYGYLANLRSKISSISSLTRKNSWRASVILAIGLLLAVDSYYAIAAAVEFDSLAYLVQYAKIIYTNNGVLDLYGPSLGLEMSAAYPIGFQALGVYFYEYIGSADDFYMRILPPIFYLLLLLACYLFSSQFFEDEKNRLLSLFAVSSTLILNYYVALSSHYITYLAFLETLALTFLTKFLRFRDERLLLISAVLGGFASLVSYLGLCSSIFLLIALLYGRVRSSLFLKALLANLSMPSIYLTRNLLLAGDPVYPFLTFSSDKLWNLRRQHFYIQSIYAGLQISNPFSIVEFLMMRCLGTRPWLTIGLLVAPIIVAFLLKRKVLDSMKTEEKVLFMFFAAAIFCFFLTSTFERYILPFIGIYACIYVWIREKARESKMNKMAFFLTLILIYSYSFTLGASLGGFRAFDSEGGSKDVLEYLGYYYKDDAKCWRWINEYTSPNDRIASFEIRHYYLDRDIFLLDGKEAAPLYYSNITIDEALNYLKSRSVRYILSPGWVSTTGILPTYKNLIITTYLGDPRYLPTIYVHGSSAIYHVGPLDTERLVAEYLSNKIIPPLLGLSIDLNVTLQNGVAVYGLEVPGDYHRKVDLTIEIISESPITVDILDGAPKDIESINSTATNLLSKYSGNGKFNWLLQSGSHVLVIRAIDDQANLQAKLRISLNSRSNAEKEEKSFIK